MLKFLPIKTEYTISPVPLCDYPITLRTYHYFKIYGASDPLHLCVEPVNKVYNGLGHARNARHASRTETWGPDLFRAHRKHGCPV